MGLWMFPVIVLVCVCVCVSDAVLKDLNELFVFKNIHKAKQAP